jgi:hypothetical protein
MDPLTVITLALVSGAALGAQSVAAQAVKDAYTGLRALIIRKTKEKKDTEVAEAIEGVEKRPNSKNREGVLREEVAAAKLDQDSEVVEKARALLALLKVQAPATYHAVVEGSGAVAQGDGATAVGERGVAVSGDVGGSINTGDVSK